MSWLYTTPLYVIVPVVVLVVLAALEAGHRLARLAPVADTQVSVISGPILLLVGLLLGFSYSMAGERYALRRATGVQEVNSIGTFWLRTSLMPEPIASEMRSRVRRYVDLHVEHRRAGIDQERMAKLEAEAARLQQELWALLLRETQREPEARALLLVTPALNAMIDDFASALAAKENRIPDQILGFLFLMVVVAAVVMGYRPRAEKRNLILWSIFVIVLGSMLVLLLDMDRPRRGFIQADSSPYLRLRESIAAEPGVAVAPAAP